MEANRKKRMVIEEMTEEAGAASAKGEVSTVYKRTKQLRGSYSTNQCAPGKDKNGIIITTEQKQADRWCNISLRDWWKISTTSSLTR